MWKGNKTQLTVMSVFSSCISRVIVDGILPNCFCTNLPSSSSNCVCSNICSKSHSEKVNEWFLYYGNDAAHVVLHSWGLRWITQHIIYNTEIGLFWTTEMFLAWHPSWGQWLKVICSLPMNHESHKLQYTYISHQQPFPNDKPNVTAQRISVNHSHLMLET